MAYATDAKRSLLGVPASLLAERGAVDADVALAMAAGCRDAFGATYGIATTGVALTRTRATLVAAAQLEPESSVTVRRTS